MTRRGCAQASDAASVVALRAAGRAPSVREAAADDDVDATGDRAVARRARVAPEDDLRGAVRIVERPAVFGVLRDLGLVAVVVGDDDLDLLEVGGGGHREAELARRA